MDDIMVVCGSNWGYCVVWAATPCPINNAILAYRHKLIIYWSEVDSAFIVEVPELPGCAADGESYQEAVQNAEIVIQEWIETAQELGRPVPEPKGRLLFA